MDVNGFINQLIVVTPSDTNVLIQHIAAPASGKNLVFQHPATMIQHSKRMTRIEAKKKL